jgi:hypothetical protein
VSQLTVSSGTLPVPTGAPGLATPVHQSAPAGAPPWRDNGWLSFWDPDRHIFGECHVSTSPNAAGCRARFSLVVDGAVFEVVEPLRPGSFASASIRFDLAGRVSVETGAFEATIVAQGRGVSAPFAPVASGVMPALVAGEPLQHHQQAADIAGEAVIAGRLVTFTGHGFRDRTWGYRDEATSWPEYLGINAVFPDAALTSMKFRAPDGSDSLEGYWLSTDRAVGVSSMTITRDARGLFAAATLAGEHGELAVRAAWPGSGFWVPMGWERTGPTMSSYAEFLPLSRSDGVEGFGRFEQGVVRTLF